MTLQDISSRSSSSEVTSCENRVKIELRLILAEFWANISFSALRMLPGGI